MILTITMNPAMDKVYTVDHFKVNDVFRPREIMKTAGGKGLNVAKVAQVMGESVIATGLLGGNIGAYIRQEVEKQGIIDEFFSIDGETRICIHIVDATNNTSTGILEPGPVITEEECEAFIVHYEVLLDQCRVVIASGSLPEGVPKDLYATLIDIAKHKNKRFILDTSGIYFVRGIKTVPYMIKPNADELTKVEDGDFSHIAQCAKAVHMFQQQGIQLPIISLGRRGCIAPLEDGIYHFTTPAIKVVNTVGSGDAFVAGCAIGITHNMCTKDIIKLGMACGTANTQFLQIGMVSKELVNRFFDMIACERITYII